MILILVLILSTPGFAQLEQPSVYATVDINYYDAWYRYEIDSTWLGVYNDTPELIGVVDGREIWGYGLPRHPNGVYKYWKLPLNTIITYKPEPATENLRYPGDEWYEYRIWWTTDYTEGTDFHSYSKLNWARGIYHTYLLRKEPYSVMEINRKEIQ